MIINWEWHDHTEPVISDRRIEVFGITEEGFGYLIVWRNGKWVDSRYEEPIDGIKAWAFIPKYSDLVSKHET